jgi:hypothetical protein
VIYRAAAEPGAHDRIDGIELIDKVIEIDQSPIGRTPRSNPATYTGMFTFLRELFAMMPEAKARGFRPGRFSFNVKGGRCEGLPGRRGHRHRDALPARRLRDRASSARGAATTARRSRSNTAGSRLPKCWT